MKSLSLFFYYFVSTEPFLITFYCFFFRNYRLYFTHSITFGNECWKQRIALFGLCFTKPFPIRLCNFNPLFTDNDIEFSSLIASKSLINGFNFIFFTLPLHIPLLLLYYSGPNRGRVLRFLQAHFDYKTRVILQLHHLLM